MWVPVTVLSMRTRSPVSTPASRATPSKRRLMRSQVVARTAPIVARSADFLGKRAASTRAKRCAERESSNVNSNPRQVLHGTTLPPLLEDLQRRSSLGVTGAL